MKDHVFQSDYPEPPPILLKDNKKAREIPRIKKKAIFPDSQSFVNLKSNTMKNTLQR